MQCRRRWSPVTLFAIVAAVAATTGISAYAAPLDYKKLADEMTSAKAPRAAEIQTDVVRSVHDEPDPLKRNNYSKDIRDNFKPLLAAKSSDVQLNAAMTIARLNTIATDSTLIEMLDHTNPAIRYWAAKGLGDIPALKAVGGHTAAIKALQARLGKETSGLVKKEIVHSIFVLGELADMIKALEILSTSMQASMPDQETLEAATRAMNEIDGATRSAAPKADEAAGIAKNTANIVSFATQQENAARTKDPASVSDAYHGALVNLVNTSVKVLNNAAGAGKSPFTGVAADSNPDQFLLLVNGITGAGAIPGQVQKVFPGTPIPPAVKTK